MRSFFFCREKEKRREEKIKKKKIHQKKGSKILSNHSLLKFFDTLPSSGKIGSHHLFVTTTNDSKIKTHTRHIIKKNFLLSVAPTKWCWCALIVVLFTFRLFVSIIIACCCCDWCSLFSFVPACRRVPVSRVWCQIGVQKPAHAFSFFLFKDARNTLRTEFFSIAPALFFFFKQAYTNNRQKMLCSILLLLLLLLLLRIIIL